MAFVKDEDEEGKEKEKEEEDFLTIFLSELLVLVISVIIHADSDNTAHRYTPWCLLIHECLKATLKLNISY